MLKPRIVCDNCGHEIHPTSEYLKIDIDRNGTGEKMHFDICFSCTPRFWMYCRDGFTIFKCGQDARGDKE